ncbi:MAG: type II toxin-antitoxin system VapC family toxin [Puniceicoccales bacterium]|jgi:predicted nucleic acid-binding protein|nr:type II toxin-antitoxin system VapC family toxin [Puniceicoccales bacterium]
MKNAAFVLDCSATLPWIFSDEANPLSDALQDDLTNGAQAWVPALWHLELGNVLLGALRKRRINQTYMETALAQLRSYDISVDAETISRAWTKTLPLSARHGLTLDDATYLELSMRRNLPLATLDSALISAAKAAGVALCLQP